MEAVLATLEREADVSTSKAAGSVRNALMTSSNDHSGVNSGVNLSHSHYTAKVSGEAELEMFVPEGGS